MTHCPPAPARSLALLWNTEQFRAYCTAREIPYERPTDGGGSAARRAWESSLARLPRERAERVEAELAAACEMGGEVASIFLLDVLGGEAPPLSVPAGIPLALYVLVHHPSLFRAAYLHHEVEKADRWDIGSAPAGIAAAGVAHDLLAEELRAFFQAGGRPPCVVESHDLGGRTCVAAHLGDRARQLRAFTGDEDERLSVTLIRPARTVLFVYDPDGGAVFLSSPLRSRERIAAILSIFGRTVLGCLVVPQENAYDLDLLKQPFRALPDAPDMESVRVRTLCLRYPARDGRRQLRLSTLSADAPDAVERMLRAHVSPAELEALRVSFAELQVRLRLDGGTKSYSIRLWPNRSNLGESERDARFRACLRLWGLSHAH